MQRDERNLPILFRELIEGDIFKGDRDAGKK
jgi:hypothetical protein